VGWGALGRMGTAAGRLSGPATAPAPARRYSTAIVSAIRSTTAGSPLMT
jgi:hypothetical protein